MNMGAVDSATAELLYRQFVVGGFTSQSSDAPRYEAARTTFGGILGLAPDKMEEVGSSIGNTIYDNYISKTMASKGILDQQDMMFLANMQSKLGLTAEQGEEMLMEAQKKVLSEEVSFLMESPDAESIKAFREKCNTLGIDLEKDLAVTKARLIKMFEIEVTKGLEAAKVTLESGEDVTEIQESLGLEAEQTEKIFEDLVLRLGAGMFQRIIMAIRTNDPRDAVVPLKRLVRYAKFVDGDLGLEVKPEEAKEIFDIYSKIDFGKDDEETIASNKELLKVALSMS
uniref:Uncharacterized protein n=1 Tax=Cyclophora tenuis TaxID=216820 RepID=A0A7S1D5A2_CYCTE